MQEIGLHPLAELGCPWAELAALERGGYASIEEVEFRRGERVADAWADGFERAWSAILQG